MFGCQCPPRVQRRREKREPSPRNEKATKKASRFNGERGKTKLDSEATRYRATTPSLTAPGKLCTTIPSRPLPEHLCITIPSLLLPRHLCAASPQIPKHLRIIPSAAFLTCTNGYAFLAKTLFHLYFPECCATIPHRPPSVPAEHSVISLYFQVES